MCFCCYLSKKKFGISILILCSIVTILNIIPLIFRSSSTMEYKIVKEIINFNSTRNLNENLIKNNFFRILQQKKIKMFSLYKKFNKIEIIFIIIIISFSVLLLSTSTFLLIIIIKKNLNFFSLILKIFFIQTIIEIILILVFLILKICVLISHKNALEKKFFSSTNKFEERLLINFLAEFVSLILQIISFIILIKNSFQKENSNKNFNIVYEAFLHKNNIYIKTNKNNQIVLVKIDENLIKIIEKNNFNEIKKFEYKNKIYSIVNNNNNKNENIIELKNTENNNKNNNIKKKKNNYKKYETVDVNSNQN